METAQRPSAPLQAIPRDQCITDAMHGVHNVLHNVILAAVKERLMEKGLAASEATRICSMGYQAGEDWDAATALKKSITQSLNYFKTNGFLQMLKEVEAYLSNNVVVTLHVALVDMKTMLDIVYSPEPKDTAIKQFGDVAADLRTRLALCCQTSQRGHQVGEVREVHKI